MRDFARFPLFIIIACLAEIFLILVFPNLVYAVFTASVVISIIVFTLFFKKKQYFSAIIFTIILLFSAINPYRAYINYEVSANRLISEIDTNDALFTARVTNSHHYQSYSVLFADISSVNGNKLLKSFPARIPSFTAAGIRNGDYIEFSGEIRSVSQIENDNFDTRSYLRSKKCFIDFQSAEITRSRASNKSSLFVRLREYSKNLIYNRLQDNFNYDVPSVSYAMFAGDKEYLSADLRETFTQSGTIHMLCVSGMHLTIISGALYSLLSLLSVHKKVRCICVISVCCLYSLFTGFSPSTVRACIMCIISFFAIMTGRKTDGYLSLFFAAFVICSASPYTILDLSLILSFLSCLGIIAFSELLPSYSGKSHFLKIIIRLTQPLIINFGAVLFTLPVSAYSFGMLSHVSVPATLIASVPAQFLMILLLFLHILSPLALIPLFDPMFEISGTAARELCSLIIKTADFFSNIKYSYTALDKDESKLYLCMFALSVLILTIFIAFGLKRARFFVCMAIICLGIVFSTLSMCMAVKTQHDYSVSYFRQNENDRQLSIRLMDYGYLLVNADDMLCTDKRRAEFDTKNGNNYLLIVPDSLIIPGVLYENIVVFNKKYGIAKIFVPKTEQGTALAKELYALGIKCSYLPEQLSFGNLDIEFYFGEFSRIKLKNTETKVTLVFADNYKKEYFDTDCDIAAFFTRKTKNQFDPVEDVIPQSDIFFTRMRKDDTLDRVINTYGKKQFIIKE